MRALLVVNPRATATTPRSRDVLSRALGSDLKLDVVETRRRGHGAALAREAALAGFDVVVALGGDGTVNEVVNGLLADGPTPELPALAVVPGGSANVFARTIGLPTDPVEATSELLGALRAGRSRLIGLGTAGERYFTFTAGLGLDAAAVRRVERARRHGQRPTAARYVRSAISEFYRATDRRHPAITLELPGEAPVPGLFLGIVSNTSPWTYLGRRPVILSPGASFETGLDLMALRRLRTTTTLRTVAAMFGERGPRGRAILARHDEAEISLTAARPLPLQVDGDYLGECEQVRFRAVPNALRVVI
ncbi:MAG TPA: diacylglycerol kinase family protein [Mycobacteriales bacterium]|nr:diacylglycerol kinase family protein [Gaiellales bacterium]HVB26640.1 diacylglycerol kinase family protein [Mycobacteriales bacterium]